MAAPRMPSDWEAKSLLSARGTTHGGDGKKKIYRRGINTGGVAAKGLEGKKAMKGTQQGFAFPSELLRGVYGVELFSALSRPRRWGDAKNTPPRPLPSPPTMRGGRGSSVVPLAPPTRPIITVQSTNNRRFISAAAQLLLFATGCTSSTSQLPSCPWLMTCEVCFTAHYRVKANYQV